MAADIIARGMAASKIAEPEVEGTNGQVLTTDGNGGRSWADVSDVSFDAIVAWNGQSTPVVANIPAGVIVTYGGTEYTGTLAAGAATKGKFYLVAKSGGSGLDNYDGYTVVQDGQSYQWELFDPRIDLSDYVPVFQKAFTAAEKAQARQNIDAQQTISDLETIRSGAEAGSTAYQSLSAYRTASAQDTIDSGKQTKITASGILQGDGSGGVTAKAVDSTATASSTNLITSGAVYAGLESKVSNTEYAPDTKTAGMTQSVGKDASGKLWTTPGGGGGSDISLGITNATVGQFSKVSAVDSDGKPTAWTPATVFYPTIDVSTQAGANVTATCNGVTVGPIVANAQGIARLTIPSFGTWSVSSTHTTYGSTSGTVTVSEVIEYTIELPLGGVYGVEWARTASPVWTRTDDAALFSDPVSYVGGMTEGDWGSPFDNIAPWSGMVRSTDPEAGELVAIPKFYYKWTNDANKMKLQISSVPLTGFFVSPAHQDKGDGKGERDVVYVGRYHCSATNYKSATGVNPKVNITRAEARAGISALGSTIWQLDEALWWTIDMLYLVEYANADCQATIGYGRGNGSSVQSMGYTDSMPYHTGTMLTSKTTYGCSTQYRNIEGLWDNCVDWCDGIYFSGTQIYRMKNPANFSDSSGGTFTGYRDSVNGVVIRNFTFSTVEGFEWAGYPAAGDASGTTLTEYFADNVYYNATGVVLSVGGGCGQNLTLGLWYRYGCSAASYRDDYVGSRLQKLP